MYNLEELTQEEVAIASLKCKNDLQFFTRFFFKLLKDNKFIMNWHHEVIIKELTKTANYEYQLLNINIPPRHSKTELAGINFIAWSLAKNPRANFLYITASDELRSETSIRIRDIITHPVYTQMFGIEIKKDQSGKNLWKTTEGGGLKTATIFGQITGFGAGRMVEHSDLIDYIKDFEGAIVMDDINKVIDSEQNNANNKKAIDTIFTTILSRKNSEDTPLINIQQRTGVNDATEALLEHYADKPHKNLCMPIVIDDKPLWEFKHSLADIKKLRTSPRTSRTFETQYMQNPQPSENITFHKDSLQYFDKINKENAVARVSYTDTADGGGDNLFTAFGYVFITDNQISCYIDEIIYNQNPLVQNAPIITNKINQHQCNHSVIESNNISSFELNELNKKLHHNKFWGIKNFKEKEARIETESPYIINVFRFRNNFDKSTAYGRAMIDLTTYLRWIKNQKDDCPDGLTGLSRFLKSKFAKYYNNM